MEEIMSPEAVGWAVTFICMWLSMRFATAFLQENPRLFTAMALFACAWALVLGYYSLSYSLRGLDTEYAQLPEKIRRQLNDLPDFENNLAFFLFVYIGGLLFLQSEAESAPRRSINIVFIQRLALWLLLFIAVPKEIEIPVPTGANQALTLDQTKAVVAGAVGLFRMACLGVGACSISTTNSQRILVVGVTVFYSYLKVLLVLERWDHPGHHLPPPLIYKFAAGKLLLTLVLGSIVAHHGMTKLLREKGPRDWISHFFSQPL